MVSTFLSVFFSFLFSCTFYVCVYIYVYVYVRASSMGQWIKNLPTMQETQEVWVQSLGWKDPLEKELATPSIILA